MATYDESKTSKTENINIINELIKISLDIEKVYINLYNLENKGKKNSSKYLKTILELKELTIKEDNIYHKLEDDIIKLYEIFKYLKTNYCTSSDDLDSLIYNESGDLAIKRIIENILNAIIFAKKDFKIESSEDLEIISEIEQAEKKDYLKKGLFIDTISSFLNFNEEDFNKKTKNKFIKVKYMLALNYKDIENRLIKNNFEIKDCHYLIARIIADILDLNDEEYRSIKNDYKIARAVSLVVELAGDIIDNLDKTDILLRKNMLRSLLIYLDEDYISLVLTLAFGLMTNADVSKSTFDDIFSNLDKDREKYKTFSYRKFNKY